MKRTPVYGTELDVDGRPKRIGVKIEPDHDTAPNVVRIFTMYADGESKRGIARTLNAERTPTRGAGGTYKGRQNSGTWSTASIKTMLENSFFMGHRVWNRWSRTGNKMPNGRNAIRRNEAMELDHVDDYCDAIIDRELWERVQARLKADKREYVTNGNANRGHQYLLSGMIRCTVRRLARDWRVPEGSPVLPMRDRGFTWQRCLRVNRVSPGGGFRAEGEVHPGFGREGSREAVRASGRAQRASDAHNQRHDEEAARLEHQLARANAALSRLVQAIESGGASPTLMQAIQRREAEVLQLQEAIDRARAQVQPRIEPRVRVDDFMSGPRSVFNGTIEHDKPLVEAALEVIEVAADGSIALVFRAGSMFRLVRWESSAVNANESRVTDLRKVFVMHSHFPGATSVAERRDGRIVLRNDSTNRVSDPNGN